MGTLYVDRASNKKGFGVGILLVSLEGAHTTISVKLDFKVTNNVVEYKASIVGLQVAAEIGVKSCKCTETPIKYHKNRK